MTLIRLVSMIALLPAALNLSVGSARATIMVPLCTGDGQVHMVPLPAGQPRLPGQDQNTCCVKGCHAGSCRKKTPRDFEPAQ